MRRLYRAVAVAAVWCLLAPVAWAQDSEETLREQARARQAEAEPQPDGTFVISDEAQILGGAAGLLFVGVDDTTVSTYVIDPADNNTQPAFSGSEVWGAAVIPGASPGDAVVYFHSGSSLYRWQHPGVPELCCSLTFGGATSSMVSMAYDPTAGELLFTKNISVEAVYSLPVTAGACPATCDVTQEWTYDSTANDFGGIALDPATGTLYGTNDTGGSVDILNPDGTTTFVVDYPAGQSDIDGLAFGNGKLYLVIDEPGDIFVYDVAGATWDLPLTNPWTTAEIFSGAGFGEGLFIPVELQSLSVE